MQPSPQLKSLVGQMPDPDDRGTLSNIDKGKVEKTVAEIHQGGRENILGLIEMLVEPGKGDDIKPHYALHCLAVYVSGLDDDQPRFEFARTLAAEIGGERPKEVQKYLIRELQVAGGREVVAALGKALMDEELCEPAAQALVAIGDGAAEQLRAALPKAGAKCRLTVVQNLGAVRDAGSIDALKEALGDEDREIRLAAAWGLANIGDAGAGGLLLKAALPSEGHRNAPPNGRDGWERTQATKACLLLAENLLGAGKRTEALKIYTHLHSTRTDPSERHVRDAAEKALTALKGQVIP